MRRSLLISGILVVAFAAGAHWLLSSSYTRYESAQLATLEAEALQLRAASSADRRLDGDVAVTLIERERLRRGLLLGSIPLATLLLIAAIFTPGRGRRHTAEELRLAQAMAMAPATLEQEKRKAAADLLGVSVQSPPSVIEAAFQAQLQRRQDERFEDASRHVKRVAKSQREALVHARDVLLRTSRAKSGAEG